MNLVSIVFFPLSWMYGAVVWFRNRCYDLHVIPVGRAGVPVISVGNITAGGSGKTPFVELLINMISRKGKNVAVISRGYRRRSSGTVVVSDGRALLQPVQHAGDEPYQIAAKFPRAIVVVDEQRYRAAQLAVGKFRVDVIVLDDGFQHRSLYRDLDIVMIDDRRSSRQRQLLPAGLLREPLSSLRRAHLLVRSSNASEQTEVLRRFTAAPVISVRRMPKALVPVNGNTARSLVEMRGKRCIAFCGIGNPESFRCALDEIQADVREFLVFPDHYSYSQKDIQNIELQAGSSSADLVITTEKDAVRLRPLLGAASSFTARCYFLEIELAVVDGERILSDRIDELMRKVA